MTVALVVSSSWRGYYAHSPYYNLLTATPSPDFELFEVTGPPEALPPEVRERILACDGIVTSPGLERYFFDRAAVPVLCVGDDMHRFDDAGIGALRAEVTGCTYFLSPYSLSRTQTDHPYRYLSGEERRKRLLLYPNCAPSRRLVPDVPGGRVRRALLTGQVSLVYPVRELMLAHGGDDVARLEFRSRLREDYFAHLARYTVGLTCNLWLDSTVAKYYEIPWVGSLLVAPLPYDAFERRLLGFVDGENMVEVTRADFVAGPDGTVPFRATLARAFALAEEGTVARAGRELVLRRHTVDSRLAYLKGLVDAIRAGGFHPDDQYDVFARCSDLEPEPRPDPGSGAGGHDDQGPVRPVGGGDDPS